MSKDCSAGDVYRLGLMAGGLALSLTAPLVAQAVAGQLKAIAAVYDIATGKVEFLT